jgi:hypothetical protein
MIVRFFSDYVLIGMFSQKVKKSRTILGSPCSCTLVELHNLISQQTLTNSSRTLKFWINEKKVVLWKASKQFFF